MTVLGTTPIGDETSRCSVGGGDVDKGGRLSTSSSQGSGNSSSVKCLSIPLETFTRSKSELRAESRPNTKHTRSRFTRTGDKLRLYGDSKSLFVDLQPPTKPRQPHVPPRLL